MGTLRSGSHVVFSIHLHIVFVTKYRRKVLTSPMLEAMKPVLERVLEANRSSLTQFNGEPDHVHVITQINLQPSIETGICGRDQQGLLGEGEALARF